MKPALLFYCQHSVGLGHLMRSYALCERLAERFRVVLLCGGELPEGIAPPADVELVPLPPLGVKPGEGFGSGDPRYTTERAWAVRAERILSALRDVAAGGRARRAVPVRAREVRPRARAAARGGARSGRVHGLQPARHPRQRRAPTSARTTTAPRALADAHLDAVLVHCDPRFARLEETFRPSAPLRVPVHYTGFVAGRRPAPGRSAASTSSSPPAAAASARRCCARRWPPSDGPPDARDRRPADARGGLRAGCSGSSRPTSSSCAPSRTSRRELQPRRGQRQPVRLQHRARPPAHARPRARRPLRDARGGRADPPRAPPAEPRRACRSPTHINGHLPRCSTSTPAPAALDLDGAARDPRPAVGAGGMSPRPRVLRPYVLRQWRALLGAERAHRRARRRRAGQAVAAGADRRPRARAAHGAVRRSTPATCALLLVGALILAIAVAESAATYFSDLWMQSAGERITHELRVAVYDHLQRLSLAFHQRSQKGDLLTRVTERRQRHGRAVLATRSRRCCSRRCWRSA